MQRFTMTVMASLVVAALGATAGTASALLPLLLNAKGELVAAEQVESKGSGSLIFEKLNRQSISCTSFTAPKATNELKQLEVLPKAFGYLGPFELKVTGCTAESGLATCMSEGAAKGEVISKGEIHLVYDSLTTLGVAVLFLINPTTKVTCETFGLKTTVSISGAKQCLVKAINTLAKTFELLCEQSGGDPKEATFWNDEGKELKASLLCSTNGGVAETCAQLAIASVISALEIKIDA